jgi:hypothetical protein
MSYILFAARGRRTPPPAPPVRSPDQDQRYAKDASGFAQIASTRSEKTRLGSEQKRRLDSQQTDPLRQSIIPVRSNQRTSNFWHSSSAHNSSIRCQTRRPNRETAPDQASISCALTNSCSRFASRRLQLSGISSNSVGQVQLQNGDA